tara:strand:+ start:90 stop:524 length:435 start_codon:yes stop_codon:yes gene_type:complete
MRSNNNNKLKAFVRFDGSGRIIPSSLIVQAFKPKVGNYKQINSKECCLNNECSAPIYGANWIIDDVVEGPTTVDITILTAPWISIEFQLLDCITNLPIASIVVPKFGEEVLTVSTAIWGASCNIRVRAICGPDFYSDWNYEFPG